VSGLPLLGGLMADAFLRTHWQKKPLVVRQAIPGFTGFVSVDDLFRFAERKDVNARLVTMTKGKRQLRTAPIPRGARGALSGPWTVLVQGIEALHDEGWPLVRRFDGVVPRARLDDLMISYATEGAGVGAHTDRYDVFLLQGEGKRRWRLQSRGPIVVDERGAVPTVKDFRPEEEHVLEAGDMLYLPPGVVHEGTAVGGPCFTYSIGAVAPSVEGLLQNFLAFQSQRVVATVDLASMYEDPDLTPPSAPSLIDDAMVKRARAVLETVAPSDDAVSVFLGRLLTGPKPNVSFAAPQTPPTAESVRRGLAEDGVVRLDRAARGLVRGARCFIAGEAYDVDASDVAWWSGLCDARSAETPARLGPRSIDALVHAVGAGTIALRRRRERSSR